MAGVDRLCSCILLFCDTLPLLTGNDHCDDSEIWNQVLGLRTYRDEMNDI